MHWCAIVGPVLGKVEAWHQEVVQCVLVMVPSRSLRRLRKFSWRIALVLIWVKRTTSRAKIRNLGDTRKRMMRNK